MLPVFATHPAEALLLAAAYLIWMLSEVALWRLRRLGPGAKAQDRLSGAVILLCIWTGVGIAAPLAFALPQFAIPWDRTFLFVAGIVLMLAGVAFRRYAIHVLGTFFTLVVAIQPGQTVVEVGPYRWLRHPSYTGALLTLFGLGLAYGNWLSLIVILLLALVGYGYRITVEERALVQALGDSYRLYMKRTKRIIPFVI